MRCVCIVWGRNLKFTAVPHWWVLFFWVWGLFWEGRGDWCLCVWEWGVGGGMEDCWFQGLLTPISL